MVADFFVMSRAVSPGLDALAEQSGREIILQRAPGAVDPFTAVKRILAGDALAPSVDALAVDRYQQNAAAVSTAEARLEKMDERHVNFAQGDGFNFHGLVFFTTEARSHGKDVFN
jgi:hypothetical protein